MCSRDKERKQSLNDCYVTLCSWLDRESAKLGPGRQLQKQNTEKGKRKESENYGEEDTWC